VISSFVRSLFLTIEQQISLILVSILTTTDLEMLVPQAMALVPITPPPELVLVSPAAMVHQLVAMVIIPVLRILV
jgi:hypothetical protein